ncbi:MAG: HAMP domain-containing protein [Chloroflexi bacterium]|nr:HAMP domain-containing protein [Chloroflexota bacterium]
MAAQTAVHATNILRLTIGLIAFFFLAALVGVFLTNRRLTRPIADLVRGTESVAAGDLDVTIPVTTQDEPGRLAQSFNRMTAVLRQTSQSLHQQNNLLAAEIEERQQAEAALRQTEEQYRYELEQRVAERTPRTADTAGRVAQSDADHGFARPAPPDIGKTKRGCRIYSSIHCYFGWRFAATSGLSWP